MASEKLPVFQSFPQVSRVSRKWRGKRPKKKGWKQARRVAEFAVCEHCGLNLNNHGIGFASKRAAMRYRGAIDHIVPERLALLTGKNPHDPLNLWCLAESCHDRIKTPADKLLCDGDTPGFLARLRENGFPMKRVESALAFYGLLR
jgi:hypothetical protein